MVRLLLRLVLSATILIAFLRPHCRPRRARLRLVRSARAIPMSALICTRAAPSRKCGTSDKKLISLHRVAKDGDGATMSKLLATGLDPNEINTFGVTPLHVAGNEGHVSVIQALLAAPKIDVDRRESMEDRTALHLAAKAGQLRCVELLLAAGARPDLVDRDGETSLMKVGIP